MKQNKIYIYGKHAVAEALLNAPQSVKKVYISPKQEDQHVRGLIKKTGVAVSELGKDRLPGVDADTTHQGVIGVVSLDDLMRPMKSFLADLKVTDETAVVLLAEIQDPHNVGAVIRSAAAFGVSGVLIPEHNQAPVTGAVVKVSAGMAFRVPLVQIGNINQAVRDLKEAGFTIYGLEGGGTSTTTDEDYDGPSAFILGNEGAGLREKTRELCDKLLSIPMHPRCESLNAAVSASVALYSWSAKHARSLKKR
ncbi:MAG: 23S rRNA (guanosine(2251)-2'-O)-methyltransferase RlmB [Candidatus Pacebacteria bacterium]|jgi:23S rRNA (guanosine2251-2'-O)-methyltransferase|nr:23S rRNA (guanosine(2251)-2'-O)-methyltransferase RlmB [Candidatus Paceibacterota bacterium]MBP9852283.1 23S rRNA (guanosine(2251)-2'-O)-methyltransferase RlmB [Candidatus Paceibacterota bacterium]